MKIYTLNNIKLSPYDSEEKLVRMAENQLGRKPGYFRLLKKSLDARNKSDVKYVYSFEFSAEKLPERTALKAVAADKLPADPIIVVGSGPAGLFCAVRLIEHGFKPIVIERGDCVEDREKKCRSFFAGGELDVDSNVQFGEGGAGTFSDGKLNTQTHSELNKEVLELFVRFGAPEEIMWLSKPHIGSDNLKNVVRNIRDFINENGGEVRFNTRFSLIKKSSDGKLRATLLRGEKASEITASAIVLAIGHSARDTFKMLKDNGVEMRPKNFAVGVRIEHLQSDIGRSQYGKIYRDLPPADYKLVSHAGARAAFTFCMCPGGYVMPATSERGAVVTNGMSNFARDGVNANSAIIVPVSVEDFGSDGTLAGVEFQRRLERAAFVCGGENYSAPVQRVEDFLEGRRSSFFGEVKPTYERGTTFANMSDILPEFVCDPIKFAINDMSKKLKCFNSPDAILTGVESRTSSPVRIERNDSLESVNVANLYPCGEGAGYAGGIMSSAADGLRVAEKIFEKYCG